jgi:hypothetical protein
MRDHEKVQHPSHSKHKSMFLVTPSLQIYYILFGLPQEFSTGSVMSFFMSTNQPLGDLLHLYIWHDNSGGSQAEWYLNQVVVYDIETLKA